MKAYASTYPDLCLTALKDGKIVRIKFEKGVFQTEDPQLQHAIESNPHFGGQIFEAGAAQVVVESPKPKKKIGRTNFDPLAEVLREEQNRGKEN